MEPSTKEVTPNVHQIEQNQVIPNDNHISQLSKQLDNSYMDDSEDSDELCAMFYLQYYLSISRTDSRHRVSHQNVQVFSKY